MIQYMQTSQPPLSILRDSTLSIPTLYLPILEVDGATAGYWTWSMWCAVLEKAQPRPKPTSNIFLSEHTAPLRTLTLTVPHIGRLLKQVGSNHHTRNSLAGRQWATLAWRLRNSR